VISFLQLCLFFFFVSEADKVSAEGLSIQDKGNVCEKEDEKKPGICSSPITASPTNQSSAVTQ